MTISANVTQQNGAAQPANPQPPSFKRHALIDAIHRELGVGRALMQEFIVSGRRWLLRPHTIDDQIWLFKRTEDIQNDATARGLMLQLATAAIGLAGIGELVTTIVKVKVEVEQIDPNDADKTIKVEEEQGRVVPAAEQPPIVPVTELFELQVAGQAGLIPAGADPFNPPNPYRELLAEQVMEFLRGLHAGISAELFARHNEVQERTEVPQLPLPRT